MQRKQKAMQQTDAMRAPMPETFVTIQYLRALAAIGIVVFHTMDMTAMRSHFPPAFGELGVDVFFVVSGFVIVTVTAQSGRGPLGFWLQRLIRVLPMYWVYTTIVLVALALVPGLFFNARDFDWSYIIRSYLLIPAVNPTVGGITPVFSLGWTLYLEMLFYFFFGLCLLLRGVALRVAALAVMIGVLVAINRLSLPFDPSAYPIFATWTSPQLLEILAGACIALVASRLMILPLPVGAMLLGLGMILYWIGRDPVHLFNIWTGAAAIAIVAGALVLERAARRHPIRAVVFLGDATFSVYLAHPFAQRIAYVGFVSATGGATAIPFGLACYFVIMVIAGLAGGILSYVLLERTLQARAASWLGAYRAQREVQPA
jgi:exopolysaccharide production protein ExoZ